MGDVRVGERDCLRSDKRLEIENFLSLFGFDFFLGVVAPVVVLVP